MLSLLAVVNAFNVLSHNIFCDHTYTSRRHHSTCCTGVTDYNPALVQGFAMVVLLLEQLCTVHCDAGQTLNRHWVARDTQPADSLPRVEWLLASAGDGDPALKQH